MRDLTESGEEVTVIGEVVSAEERFRKNGSFLKAVLEDEYGGRLQLLWFQGIRWIARLLLGSNPRLSVSGIARRSQYGGWSMIHPEMDFLDRSGPAVSTGRIIAIYPGGRQFTQNAFTSRTFRRVMHHLFLTYGLQMREEILPKAVVQEHELMNWRVALRSMHFPRSQPELDKALFRLKFEELFLRQVMLQRTRSRRAKLVSDRLTAGVPLLNEFVESLPFTLTNGQRTAIDDIIHDTGCGFQMNRLLQGDVGSGKTVVAVASLLLAVGSGKQGAIMAPTEVLAEQHYKTLVKLMEPMDIHVSLLVGGQRARVRREVLSKIVTGTTKIVVGTHALFQEEVEYNNLGSVVIDEQHRFGVQQRASMQEKGENPHILLMTATPIPRSLALTMYGDLDMSLIKELPAGRQPIKTQLFTEGRRQTMLNAIRREINKGRQAYAIFPQVEESEATNLRDAVSGFEKLKGVFPDYSVGLVHGRMSSEEKEEVMDRFASGETDLLVATTVIEVGIDAPNATIIVIEHAERFGLSQLHQLRGRVGRGAHASRCILMAGTPLSRVGRKRLHTLTQTTDGFVISDKDLELRGSGDFFGTRQHGDPGLKIADLIDDSELIEASKSAAEKVVTSDPELEKPENASLSWYYDQFVIPEITRLYRVG